MATYKNYSICFGDVVQETLPIANPFVTYYTNFINVPSFVELEEDILAGNYIGWQINGNTTGQFTFTFQEFTGTGFKNWTVNINIGACGTVVYDNCCDNQYNIAWLNREGGWQNYIFTGIKTFEIRQGDSTTFKTFSKVLKYQSKTNVYNGVVVTTGSIPRSHVDYLSSLRTSIQAYLYNDVTQGWDIEIFIDTEDFETYTSRQKIFDISIPFIYAKELIVQSQ
jgi:hypothetical protein